MDRIDILLATYNGEIFLKEQIDSILNQTYKNIKLIIHDDGSSDKTVKIINEYQSLYTDKILFINDGIKTGGAKNNFSHLLKFSDAKYIMFCDQDDVWIKNKIKLFYDKMIESELMYPSMPLVVFSDLIIVDEHLNIVNNSMVKYQKLNPEIAKSFNLLKCQNVITGCAMMINKKILTYACPIPNNILMHDWWIALIAAKHGQNIYLNISTVKYRQHSFNVVGSKKITISHIIRKIFSKKIFNDYINLKNMLANLNEPLSIQEFLFCKVRVTILRFFNL